MAYPVYENSGILITSTSASLSLDYPSSISANDILIAVVAKDGTYGSGNATAPSGFTYVAGTDGSGDNFQTRIYWKRAVGSELGSITFTWDNTPTTVTAGMIHRYSGCITTGNAYYQVNASATAGSASSTANIPACNTGGDQRLVMSYVFVKANTSVATASDYTHITLDVTTVGVDITFKSQSQQVPTAPSVPSDTSTLGASSYWASYTVSLIPAVTDWPHNYLGVDNADINEINTVAKSNIKAVNTVE